MFLEILIREGVGPTWTHEGRGWNEYGVRIPISHAWQEGPDDLHIHFTDDECVYCPAFDEKSTGDYIVPCPSGKGLARAYHLMFLNHVSAPVPVASKEYVERLKEVWPSPNSVEWKGEEEVKSFLKKLAETVKGEK